MGAVPQPRVWFSLQGHVNDTKASMTHDPEPDTGGEPQSWEQDEEWSRHSSEGLPLVCQAGYNGSTK